MAWILVIFIALVAFAEWTYAIKLYHLSQDTKEFNLSIDEQNRELEQHNRWLSQEEQKASAKLEAINKEVLTQTDILSNLTLTAEIEKLRAQERAQQEHDIAVAALKQDYDEQVKQFEAQKKRQQDELTSHLAINQRKIESQEAKIKVLKDLQDSYLKARKEEQEIREKQDYYRLALASTDKEDIKLLRSVAQQISRPDTIDKVVWENYYRPAYDTLMTHLFTTPGKFCGIYMITNLTTKQAYIGQSVDIKERFRQHIKSGLSSTTTTNKLYQSMKQYGVDNFTFQILEEVPRESLNEREAFWIDFYQTKIFGLNSTRGNDT